MYRLISLAARAVVFSAASAMLGGCGAIVAALAPPPPSGAQPGNFANLEVVNFSDSDFNITDTDYAEQSMIDQQMSQHGWSDRDKSVDNNVSAQNFVTAASNDDILFFNGHGVPGDLLLYWYNKNTSADLSQFGVGNSSGTTWNGFRDPANPKLLYPRLKWMVFDASDTVAPDVTQDPNDNANYTVPAGAWSQIFGSSNNDLRGIFGYWQPPGICSLEGSDPNRDCDVKQLDSEPAMRQFIGRIWNGQGSYGEKLASAWQAANMNSYDTMQDFAILQDCNTTGDVLTSDLAATSSSGTSGQLCYTNSEQLVAPARHTMISMSSAQNQTFTLSPQTVVRPSLNVSGLVQEAESYAGVGTATTLDNGTTTTYVSQNGMTGRYYYGLSGGVTFDGEQYTNAVAFDEPTAENAADTFINDSWGMPADAALSSVIGIYRSIAGSRTLIGYVFVWTHSAGNVLGGDYMAVGVDDKQKITYTCLQWIYEYDPETRMRTKECDDWQENISDQPAIMSGYDLWRSIGGTRVTMTAGGRTTGQQSIDAYTASLSLGTNSVTSYTAGYWTNYIDSSDTVAHPAWIFTLTTGQKVAVDAFTGTVL